MILGHYANEPYSPKYEAFKVVKAENKSLTEIDITYFLLHSLI